MALGTLFSLLVEHEANYKADGLEMYSAIILFAPPQDLQFISSGKTMWVTFTFNLSFRKEFTEYV